MTTLWKQIEDLNYDDTRDYEAIKKYLMAVSDPISTTNLRSFVSAREAELHVKVEFWEQDNGRLGNYGGDDSFHDLLSHAVSMGREYFYKAMNNPAILKDLDYQECFDYCFPYSDDWDGVV